MARIHFCSIGIPHYILQTKIKGMAWLERCLMPHWGHLDTNTIQKWLPVVTLIWACPKKLKIGLHRSLGRNAYFNEPCP